MELIIEFLPTYSFLFEDAGMHQSAKAPKTELFNKEGPPLCLMTECKAAH